MSVGWFHSEYDATCMKIQKLSSLWYFTSTECSFWFEVRECCVKLLYQKGYKEGMCGLNEN